MVTLTGAADGEAACAALDARLELRGVLDVHVRRLQLRRDQLQLRVELGDPILREQPQQVEAEDRVLALRLGEHGGEVGVVDFELREDGRTHM